MERLDAAVRRIEEHVRGRIRRGVTHDDAEETIDGDGAVGFDPFPLLAALDRHGARVVVIGQVAGILHGSRELTGDLDVLWSGSSAEAPRVAAGFADVDASVFDDESLPLPLDAEAFRLPKVLFHSAGASGDCCTPRLPWGPVDVVGIIERADATRGRGVTIHYASLADLIEMRRVSGRPKDVRRLAELNELASRAG